MSEGFSGEVFQSLSSDRPLLAVLFKDGDIVRWRDVPSLEEGERIIAETLAGMPPSDVEID